MKLYTLEPSAFPLGSPEPIVNPALRVLHVLEATLGGTLRYIENLLDALAPAAFPSALAYGVSRADHRLQPALAHARELGWTLYEVPMGREIRPASDMSAAWSLARVMRQFAPTVVHCHSSKAGALGRVVGWTMQPRPRMVYSPHALAPASHFLRIERGLSRLTDQFLAVSASERDQLVALNVSRPEETGVVYPTIDAEAYRPANSAAARAQLALPPHRPLLLSVGRMTGQKRPLDYLDVLQQVRRQVPDCGGVWVGDGELRDAFEQKATDMGLLPHLRITGWIPDVRPYIAASDVVLSTSGFESFGYSLAEALAMERPCVGSRVPGTADVLGDFGEDAFFEVGDTGAAAARVTALLQSPERSAMMARAGRAVVMRRFSSDAMRRDLLAFYGAVLPGAGLREEPLRRRA